MKRENLVINTLVYLEQLKNGTLQEELIEPLAGIGIHTVEIRRDFIQDIQSELPRIRAAAHGFNTKLLYSVPDILYRNGTLDYESLTRYFEEANMMGASQVKLCIGDYQKIEQDDVDRIKHLCEEENISLTIENDQTADNGRSEKIYHFLEEIQSMGGGITATFDIGNWLWQKEEPMKNARLLKPFVTYIHLKDVKGGTAPYTTLLDDGDIQWREVLGELPDVPVALEYPCGSNPTEQLNREIQKLSSKWQS